MVKKIIFDRLMGNSEISNTNNSWFAFKDAFQSAILSDTWHEIKCCDVLLIRHDAHCSHIYQGKAYSPLIDSLCDFFIERGLRVCSIAAPYSKLTGTLAYNSPVSCNRSFVFIALLRRFARLIKGRINGEEWANKLRANLWDRILEKANPCCVIGIQPDIGLCRAGKTRNIPIYDYQHGVIADEHPWYGERYRIETSSEDLPDGFLCYDETSAMILRKWAPRKGIDVRVVGNIWFSRFLSIQPNDLLVQEAINNFKKIFKNNRPVILVSLQWGMDLFYKYDGFNGVIVDALEKTILETADSYNWLLRMHPIQQVGKEKKMVESYLTSTFGHLSSVEWHICSKLPLPLVLQQTDLHITDMSTIVTEASWMGIYSALLNGSICPGGTLESYYAHERCSGIAEVLQQNPEIIKKWIKTTLTKGRRKSTMVGESIAMQTFIEQIIGASGRQLIHSSSCKE